jgi:hypothetical protein
MSVRVAWEHHFHTAEQVSEYLAEAVRILEAHDLDPALMDATLAQVVGLLAAKQVQFEQLAGVLGNGLR